MPTAACDAGTGPRDVGRGALELAVDLVDLAVELRHGLLERLEEAQLHERTRRATAASHKIVLIRASRRPEILAEVTPSE
jgi:hypothetical protein